MSNAGNPTVRLWFPVAVYDEVLDCDIASLRTRARQIYELHYKENISYPNGYTTFNQGVDLKPVFPDLCEKIDAAAHRFAERLGMNLQTHQISMADFWINFNNKHCHHEMHNHTNSFISGAFYIHSPKNGGSFVIYDPKVTMRMYEPPFVKDDAANFKQVSYTPTENVLILFPSYLMHSVETNRSEETRISISFNYVFGKR